MGFRDDVTVLWEGRIKEADSGMLWERAEEMYPGQGGQTVEEAGSPFELIEGIFGDESRTGLNEKAYRQVSYVNDVSFPNAQVLSEYAVNGGMGESLTGYSYGVWRESFSVAKGAGLSGTTTAGAASVDGAGIKNAGMTGRGVSAGTYYYTGTGSVANLVSGSGTVSYAYGTDGSRSPYGAENTDLYVRTQAAVYGYNGEYTHESMGMQYLRARYLNMATGTFLSRDTYGGTMDNILSQNRYAYVGNNPVNYADPDGHKAVGTTVKNTFSAMAATTRKAAQEAKNQTSKAAEIAAAKSGKGAAAVSMAANRITRNEVNGVNRGTTKGGAAVQSAEERITSGTKAGPDRRDIAHAAAATIDCVLGKPWVESAAGWTEQKACAAYDYCDNQV